MADTSSSSMSASPSEFDRLYEEFLDLTDECNSPSRTPLQKAFLEQTRTHHLKKLQQICAKSGSKSHQQILMDTTDTLIQIEAVTNEAEGTDTPATNSSYTKISKSPWKKKNRREKSQMDTLAEREACLLRNLQQGFQRGRDHGTTPDYMPNYVYRSPPRPSRTEFNWTPTSHVHPCNDPSYSQSSQSKKNNKASKASQTESLSRALSLSEPLLNFCIPPSSILSSSQPQVKAIPMTNFKSPHQPSNSLGAIKPRDGTLINRHKYAELLSSLDEEFKVLKAVQIQENTYISSRLSELSASDSFPPKPISMDPLSSELPGSMAQAKKAHEVTVLQTVDQAHLSNSTSSGIPSQTMSTEQLMNLREKVKTDLQNFRSVRKTLEESVKNLATEEMSGNKRLKPERDEQKQAVANNEGMKTATLVASSQISPKPGSHLQESVDLRDVIKKGETQKQQNPLRRDVKNDRILHCTPSRKSGILIDQLPSTQMSTCPPQSSYVSSSQQSVSAIQNQLPYITFRSASTCPSQNETRSSSVMRKSEDTSTPTCRICMDAGGKLISPCECKGSSEYVHPDCLNAWRNSNPLRKSSCEVCLSFYKGQSTLNPNVAFFLCWLAVFLYLYAATQFLKFVLSYVGILSALFPEHSLVQLTSFTDLLKVFHLPWRPSAFGDFGPLKMLFLLPVSGVNIETRDNFCNLLGTWFTFYILALCSSKVLLLSYMANILHLTTSLYAVWKLFSRSRELANVLAPTLMAMAIEDF